MTIREIHPHTLHALLTSNAELALFDIRAEPQIRTSHIFHAAYFPTKPDRHLAHVLVPRPTTTVILTGDDNHNVTQQAHRWTSWGYKDIRILTGGLDAWISSGQRVYRHLCCPSKALAETGAATHNVQSWTVDDLASTPPPLVVDVRTREEYTRGSIPNALNLPGGEIIALPNLKLKLNHDGPIIVTCAFRTRGLFAATSLQWWGVSNVFFLDGGTTAWEQAGYTLIPGSRFVSSLKLPDLRGHPGASGISYIDSDGVEILRQNKTVYIIDPRLDPHPDPQQASRHIPAGQYLEAIDEYTPVYRSCVVLVDAEPYTTAICLARWLRASRLVEVYVLVDGVGVDSSGIPRPTHIPPPDAHTSPAPTVDGLMEDYTEWSLALPAMARIELGGFAFE